MYRTLLDMQKSKELMTQQIAPLPPQRLTPEQPPFTFTGLDFFGPPLTKLARKKFKRYGCVFTCPCSRAIHLEMAYDLSTKSFLCATSNFIARSRRPSGICSDNRTNSVGGEREFREQLKKLTQANIDNWTTRRNINWNFIAACAFYW